MADIKRQHQKKEALSIPRIEKTRIEK